MAKKDYYAILGLTADDRNLQGKEFNDKLSKEFRKLSLKWHPDRWVNGTDEEKKTAEEKFKEIAEAYSVLSDEQKRDEYDNGGVGFNPFPNGFDPFGPSGPLHGFGGFSFRFGDQAFNQTGKPTPMRGSNVLVDVSITLYEAYDGGTKKVTYKCEKECDHCHGTGAENGKLHACPHCNGVGKIVKTSRDNFGVSQIITDCPYCGGTGKEPDKKCSVCGGIGTVTKSETRDITIPRGVDNGTTIGYSGLGNPGKNGGPSGSLEVRFTIKNEPYFIRNGSNLTHVETVPIEDALLGCEREVRAINGNTLKITLSELTKFGEQFKYPGLGMPTLDRYGRNGPNGDYIVVITYEYPKKLSKRQKELLKDFKKG